MNEITIEGKNAIDIDFALRGKNASLIEKYIACTHHVLI